MSFHSKFVTSFLLFSSVFSIWSCSSNEDSSADGYDNYAKIDYIAIYTDGKKAYLDADGGLNYVSEAGSDVFVDGELRHSMGYLNGFGDVASFNYMMNGDKYYFRIHGRGQGKLLFSFDDIDQAGIFNCKAVPLVHDDSCISIYNADRKEEIQVKTSPDGREIIMAAPYFSCGWLAVTDEDGKRHFVDTDGNFMNSVFDDSNLFYEDYALVIKENKPVLIDIDGNVVAEAPTNWSPFSLEDYRPIPKGYFFLDPNENLHMLHYDGTQVSFNAKISPQFYHRNYFTAYTVDGRMQAYDYNGNVISESALLLIPVNESTMYRVENNHSIGTLINMEGEIVKEFKDWENVVPFNAFIGFDNKFGLVGYKDDSYYYLTPEGTQVCEISFGSDIFFNLAKPKMLKTQSTDTHLVDNILDAIKPNGVGRFVYGEEILPEDAHTETARSFENVLPIRAYNTVIAEPRLKADGKYRWGKITLRVDGDGFLTTAIHLRFMEEAKKRGIIGYHGDFKVGTEIDSNVLSLQWSSY